MVDKRIFSCNQNLRKPGLTSLRFEASMDHETIAPAASSAVCSTLGAPTPALAENSLLFTQGNRPQPTEITARYPASRARKVAISKNSLLNSLFSGKFLPRRDSSGLRPLPATVFLHFLSKLYFRIRPTCSRCTPIRILMLSVFKTFLDYSP